MNYQVNLKSDNEVISIIVPKKPIESENKRQYEVYINKKDGTLERVYRFEKYSIISIIEVK